MEGMKELQIREEKTSRFVQFLNSEFFYHYRHNLPAMIGSVLVLLAVLVAVFGKFLAPQNPYDLTQINLIDAYLPPSWAGGDPRFFLGTDDQGRCILSAIIYGSVSSLTIGLLGTIFSCVIGTALGLIAGYFGGVADMIIMRFTDMVMSFPYILLVLVAASIFKPGLWNIILILGFVDWPGIARLVRGNVLSLRETNFIKGNIVAGMPLRHILFSEILPNTAAPILVYATSVLALSMLDEAALSFLGLGVQPPTASLGNMLNGAQSLTVLTKQPWLWIPPGLLIVVLVIAINFIGDALRDALDPNSRN